MKKVRIKPVYGKPVKVKGKTVGTYSISSTGRVTIRSKPPKF